MAAFEELGILPEICAGLEEMDWLLPTDVQQEAVPLILTGMSVCLYVSLSTCVCLFAYVCLAVCLSVYRMSISVCVSVLRVYLSACLYSTVLMRIRL